MRFRFAPSERARSPHTASFSGVETGDFYGEGQIRVKTENVVFDAEPGESFPLRVLTTYSGGGRGALEADGCVAQNLTEGAKVVVQTELAGRPIATEQFCLPAGLAGGEGNPRIIDESVTLPEAPGTYDLVTTVVGADSGRRFARVVDEIDVTTADVGGGGDSAGCPEGFVRDPETGECVPVDERDSDRDRNNDSNRPPRPPSGCTLADAINPANSCSLSDAVGGSSLILGGAGFAVFLLLLFVVLAGE